MMYMTNENRELQVAYAQETKEERIKHICKMLENAGCEYVSPTYWFGGKILSVIADTEMGLPGIGTVKEAIEYIESQFAQVGVPGAVTGLMLLVDGLACPEDRLEDQDVAAAYYTLKFMLPATVDVDDFIYNLQDTMKEAIM